MPETLDPISGNVVHEPYKVPDFTADLNNVFSTSNITQATTNPTAAPDDLLNIRNTIYNELGIPNLQKQYQDIYKSVLGFDLGTTAQQVGIEGQPVAMNVIRGSQAQAAQQRALQRQGLVAQADVAQSSLQAALGEAGVQYGIRAQEVEQKRAIILQYPGAKITFGDSLDTVAKKLDKYQKEAEKDAYKAELKKMAMSLGIKTSGSRKELEKRISKVNKKARQQAEEEANLKMEAMRWDIENTKSTIKNRGGASSGEKLSSDISSMNSQLMGQIGTDWKVAPENYNYAKNAWISEGNSATTFDNNFSHLVNPSRAGDYNIGYSFLKQVQGTQE
jgi:hypothetical protein